MNRAIAALALIACSFLAGCTGDAFYVDDRFTPSEEQQIQRAADEWEAIGAPHIDFVWRQHVDITDSGRHVIVRSTVRSAVSAWEPLRTGEYRAVTLRGIGHERILMLVDQIEPESFASVIAHEFGHHFSLPHSSRPEAVMYRESKALGPTEFDAQALRGIVQ